MTKEQDFRTRIISLFNSMYPDIPVVASYQNNAQVADIRKGDPMADILIERFIKVGTDYSLPRDDGAIVWIGDRLVQVQIELFCKDSLSMLTEFRDRLETYAYRNMQNVLGMMEQRTHQVPISSTRMHGTTQYVESAKYVTRFHATVSYIDGVGVSGETLIPVSTIDHGLITANINENLSTISF